MIITCNINSMHVPEDHKNMKLFSHYNKNSIHRCTSTGKLIMVGYYYQGLTSNIKTLNLFKSKIDMIELVEKIKIKDNII